MTHANELAWVPGVFWFQRSKVHLSRLGRDFTPRDLATPRRGEFTLAPNCAREVFAESRSLRSLRYLHRDRHARATITLVSDPSVLIACAIEAPAIESVAQAM